MILGGVFNRLPGLKPALGHLGDGVPFHLSRIEDKLPSATSGLPKPVADNRHARDWFDRLALDPEAREKVAHGHGRSTARAALSPASAAGSRRGLCVVRNCFGPASCRAFTGLK
ncbi:hypothetical protein GCM10027360_30920 [Amycolatopsis echigonensis]